MSVSDILKRKYMYVKLCGHTCFIIGAEDSAQGYCINTNFSACLSYKESRMVMLQKL